MGAERRSPRTSRLDSQIHQELMELLQREMKDPRLGFATVTRVATARDLGHVTAWVSVYGDEDVRLRSMKALQDATPWLRRMLAERLQLRRVPELVLRRDDSIEAGDRVLKILHDLEDELSNGGEESADNPDADQQA